MRKLIGSFFCIIFLSAHSISWATSPVNEPFLQDKHIEIMDIGSEKMQCAENDCDLKIGYFDKHGDLESFMIMKKHPFKHSLLSEEVILLQSQFNKYSYDNFSFSVAVGCKDDPSIYIFDISYVGNEKYKMVNIGNLLGSVILINCQGKVTSLNRIILRAR